MPSDDHFDRNEKRPADEGNKQHAIELPRDVRKKLEDAFQCIESCNNYFPLLVLCLLEGIKLTILGDTTTNNDTPALE